MRITRDNQYNQGIGRNKLLSSTAGVGSIVTTNLGYYILISDINKWKFVLKSQTALEELRNEEPEEEKRHQKSLGRVTRLGLVPIEDERFVQFLRLEKELPNLLGLVNIPHLSLDERYNSVNFKNSPVEKALRIQGYSVTELDFTVFATHFPKWFRNPRGILKKYDDWKRDWQKANLPPWCFVPPRDANKVIKNGRGETIKIKISELQEIPLHEELIQSNLVLICPHGHLSDIPWPQYLEWKESSNREEQGEELLRMKLEDCKHEDLIWTESTTKSEGYQSIFLECTRCKKKANLEGIMNIQPTCCGEKPWEVELDAQASQIPRDQSCHSEGNGTQTGSSPQTMRVALVTGNNLYFANGFSSLYIPKHLSEDRLASALKIATRLYTDYLQWVPNASKADFSNIFLNASSPKATEFGDLAASVANFWDKLREKFLKEIEEPIKDRHEHYRWQEYSCFLNNPTIKTPGLVALDITLPSSLAPYFKRIKQIEELQISQVQLDFSRVQPKERIIREGEVSNAFGGKEIFSIPREEVYVLPANGSLGEGLFFEFNEDNVQEWLHENYQELDGRVARLTRGYNKQGQSRSLKIRLHIDRAKHLLIHTFSHILMRELEFSCGYPTASLHERLYISDRMSGLLIYTSEGSEGSMGGLIWQGHPENIEALIRSGMERAFNCSSDPLCWESEGQGIFDLNLAACFSCSLVSETSCEERNLLLDRRALVDPEFGYFRGILK